MSFCVNFDQFLNYQQFWGFLTRAQNQITIVKKTFYACYITNKVQFLLNLRVNYSGFLKPTNFSLKNAMQDIKSI
jgi:hypothetical protein